jgi:hypothetical protein
MPAAELSDYRDRITSPERRRDAETMIELMRRVTGEEPVMWGGSVVGFGRYRYLYTSGREGDGPATAFSARTSATTVYLVDGVEAHATLLEGLGPHTTGVGSIYLKDLSLVNMEVLEAIVARSYATLTADTYTKRAREGREG